MIYCYIMHAGSVISAGTGLTRGAASLQALALTPDCFGNCAFSACRLRFFLSTV
jgi:hypothetical protein